MFFKDTSAEKDMNRKYEKETLEVACLREENYEMPVKCTKKVFWETKY